MHRFYSPNSKFSSKSFFLNDTKEIHHLKNVLRLKKKSQIRLFNNNGEEALGEIITIDKDCVEISLKGIFKSKKANKIHTILACAIPKKSKFELIIEKCTELGVDEIIPLKTKRTEGVPPPDRLEKKRERFQTVAINATKQCKRTTIPVIHPILTMTEALKIIDNNTLALIPCLDGKRKTIKSVLDTNKKTKIIYFIGPEGDFTENELTLALKNSCIPVTLGETVLKVDTAAISVLSAIHLFTF